MLTRKIFESRVSEMPFTGLWGEILQNSDALANVFALSPKPGGPQLGLGAPGFSRSEPIVVTPLPLTIKAQSVSIYSVNIVIPKIISIQLTPC